MILRGLFSVLICGVFLVVSGTGAAALTLKVTMKTLSCGGIEGFASVEADKIVKIERSKCAKEDPVAEVYQILVDKASGAGYEYRVFTTTKKEARRVIEKIDKLEEGKAKAIEGSSLIIVD